MIKFSKQCKVCATIRSEGTAKSKLLKRIYESTEFNRNGEQLTSIYKDYDGKFSYQSLCTHAKRHQALSEQQLSDRAIQRVAKSIQVDKLKGYIKYQDLQKEIIDRVMLGIDEGEIKLSARDGLQAAKQISDKEDKQLDQQQEMLKMFALFASGEVAAAPVIEGEVVAN